MYQIALKMISVISTALEGVVKMWLNSIVVYLLYGEDWFVIEFIEIYDIYSK